MQCLHCSLKHIAYKRSGIRGECKSKRKHTQPCGIQLDSFQLIRALVCGDVGNQSQKQIRHAPHHPRVTTCFLSTIIYPLGDSNFSLLNCYRTMLGRTFVRAIAGHATRTFASVSKVGVVGLGLMGHGVAQISAQSGFEVVGVESTEEACARGKSLIDTSLSKVQARKVKKGLSTQEEADAEAAEILGRLTTTTDIQALADCDLVIEVP